MGGDLLGGTFLNQLAVLEDSNLIADVLDDGQIVRDKKIGKI